jgi:hypothetical protein
MLFKSIVFLFLFISKPIADTIKTIHVFVALCDNENQGIVPVSKKLGNGEDLKDNLYWGAAYGVKSFFKKNVEWKLIYDSLGVDENILERCVFKRGDTYLCADAYRGIKIKSAITNVVKSISRELSDSLTVDGHSIRLFGNSDLIAYVGHNGLMDFKIDHDIQPQIRLKSCDVIILCCMSKQYFHDIIKVSGGIPLLLTTNLMAPEAYVLESVVNDWDRNRNSTIIRENAAIAYDKYQKCGLNSSRRLFFAE